MFPCDIDEVTKFKDFVRVINEMASKYAVHHLGSFEASSA